VEEILGEVLRALEAKFYYLALIFVLTLPDICAALESADGESSGPRYKAWVDANLASYFPELTASDMWQLRCGVLHQGRCGHARMPYARIIFTMPTTEGRVSHNRIIKDALNVDLALFSFSVVHAVREWLQRNAQNPTLHANLPNLVRVHAHGMPPYIDIDMPVIA
jgi:hypothetical protein